LSRQFAGRGKIAEDGAIAINGAIAIAPYDDLYDQVNESYTQNQDFFSRAQRLQ
jgi:hypothetical protein